MNAAEGGADDFPDRPRDLRRFLALWASQTVSLFGTFIALFGVQIWLTRDLYPLASQKAELALALTATTLASTAPLILIMPLAGAWADRHDRRRTMIACDVANALLALALALLIGLRQLSLGPAVVLLTAISAAGAFHSASLDSGYGWLVPVAQLQRANAMMQTSFGLSTMLAPPLAALLISVPQLAGRAGGWLAPLGRLESGTLFAFLADAASFAFAAVVLAFLRLPSPPRAGPAPTHSLWRDVREGLEWILRRRPFVWLIGFGSLANLMFAPLMLLLPVLVRDRLGADLAARSMPYEAALALVSTAGGLGAVLGGVAVSVWGGATRARPQVMVGAMVVLGVGQIVAGSATTLWMCAAGMFLGEMLIPLLNSTSFALWQTLTPAHLLGRALSSRRFIAQSFFPLGTLVAGWLAVPIEPWIVVTIAGSTLALVCAAQFLNPRFATIEAQMREAAAR